MALISSHNNFVKSKQDIAYVGIACATALIKISLPAFDNSFSFHRWIFFHTLSFKYANIFYLERPINGQAKVLVGSSFLRDLQSSKEGLLLLILCIPTEKHG
jgi:hypothetical protein